MVLLKISFALLLSSALTVRAIPHGLKVEPRLTKRAECTSGIQVGFQKNSVGRVGDVYQLNLADKTLGPLLYAAGSSGPVGGIAVNSGGVEFKASNQGVFSATRDADWIRESNLKAPPGIEFTAAGALPDGRFMFATYLFSGTAHICNEAMSIVYHHDFINQETNSRAFCGDPLSCIFDIAIDGNGHAWVIDYHGHIFISVLSQLISPGGLMKYIGRIDWDYPESSTTGTRSNGIAFDAEGHVYYSLFTATLVDGVVTYKSFVLRASMLAPFTTTVAVDPVADTVFGDLASCYFPTVNISSLLN